MQAKDVDGIGASRPWARRSPPAPWPAISFTARGEWARAACATNGVPAPRRSWKTLSAANEYVRQTRPASKIAILVAMSVSEQMPLADVKNHLSEVVDRLQREHGRVIITRHGHPAAVVMSVEDLESLEETLDIMDSAALLSDIRESLAELGTTEPAVLTKEDALRLISGQ
jgi:antitoxin YefM